MRKGYPWKTSSTRRDRGGRTVKRYGFTIIGQPRRRPPVVDGSFNLPVLRGDSEQGYWWIMADGDLHAPDHDNHRCVYCGAPWTIHPKSAVEAATIEQNRAHVEMPYGPNLNTLPHRASMQTSIEGRAVIESELLPETDGAT